MRRTLGRRAGGAVVAWQAGRRALGIPDYLLPAPSAIAQALWDDRPTLATQTGVTLREMLFGFALAMASGLGAAIVLRRCGAAHAVYPLLIGSQSVPSWRSLRSWSSTSASAWRPRSLIVALVCFFPISVNALDGFARRPDVPCGRCAR